MNKNYNNHSKYRMLKVKVFCILFLTFNFLLFTFKLLHSEVPRYTNGIYEMKMTAFTICGSTRTTSTVKEYYTFGEQPYTTILTSGGNSARIGFLSFAIAPTAVTNLSALVSRWGRCVELTWTTPWGDTPNGTINSGAYRIRYSTYANLDTTFWDSGSWNDFSYKNEIVWSTNTSYNVAQFRRLTNLVPSVTYYVRLWTRDNEVYNWSEISNGATSWAQWVILGVQTLNPATYYFTTLSPAQTDISTSAIVVENTGNVYQDYGLRIDTNAMVSYGNTWRIDDTANPGNNIFVLEGIFYQNLQPKNTDFSTGVGSSEDVITSTLKWSSNIVFHSSTTVTNARGMEVVPFEDGIDDRRRLWFKVTMPLATSTTAQQVVPVEVRARESIGVGPPP